MAKRTELFGGTTAGILSGLFVLVIDKLLLRQ